MLLLVSHKNTSKVFDWIQARRDIFPGQSSYLQSSLTVSVCFESLSCWNILLLPELWRLETILSDSILVYPQTFTPPSINGTQAAHVIANLPLCLTIVTVFHYCSPDQIYAKNPGQVYLGLSVLPVYSQYPSGFFLFLRKH